MQSVKAWLAREAPILAVGRQEVGNNAQTGSSSFSTSEESMAKNGVGTKRGKRMGFKERACRR